MDSACLIVVDFRRRVSSLVKCDFFVVVADFDLDVSHASEAWRHAIENSDNLAKFTEKTEVRCTIFLF